MNYLALLGWAPSGGTREMFSAEDWCNEFSLERVTPSPAVFDMEKLYWLNRHYIEHANPERLINAPRRTSGKRDFSGHAQILIWKFRIPPQPTTEQFVDRLVTVFVPADRLDQLPGTPAWDLITRRDGRARLP